MRNNLSRLIADLCEVVGIVLMTWAGIVLVVVFIYFILGSV